MFIEIDGVELIKSAHSESLSVLLLKLDVDGHIDSIHLFLSPRQVHLLLDMLAAIAGPGKYQVSLY